MERLEVPEVSSVALMSEVRLVLSLSGMISVAGRSKLSFGWLDPGRET